MATAPKRVVGRPFPKGQSGNPGGRPPDPLLAALRSKMTPERADQIADALLAKAEAGDTGAAEMIWNRLAGKVPNRNENGDPGSFSTGLEDVETSQIKAALKRVK